MKKKNKRILVTVSVILLIALTIILTVVLRGRKELTLNTVRVNEQTIEVTVMATGYVQPVEDVEVGTQVSGVIEKIYVDYNSQVTKGQLLAELDKSNLQEKLNQSNASMAKAQSDLTYARQNYDRTLLLHNAKAATTVDLEAAENQLAQAQTAYQNAMSNLNQSKVDLSYAYIYSPIDGIVLDRAVNEGQTVAASFNTPTLFTIAEDLTKMQVEADVDEADIGQVKLGQSASFTVDAFSDDIFVGTVNQIRLQPVVNNNVVTYTVIIEAPNPDEKLYPGMTANITIVVESETGLTVPIEATNFDITPEIADKIVFAPEITPESAPVPPFKEGQKVVWVNNGEGQLAPRLIETGMNDGIDVVVKTGLREGEEVVLSAVLEKKGKSNKPASNPFMPSPPRGRTGGGPR